MRNSQVGNKVLCVVVCQQLLGEYDSLGKEHERLKVMDLFVELIY